MIKTIQMVLPVLVASMVLFACACGAEGPHPVVTPVVDRSNLPPVGLVCGCTDQEKKYYYCLSLPSGQYYYDCNGPVANGQERFRCCHSTSDIPRFVAEDHPIAENIIRFPILMTDVKWSLNRDVDRYWFDAW